MTKHNMYNTCTTLSTSSGVECVSSARTTRGRWSWLVTDVSVFCRIISSTSSVDRHSCTTDVMKTVTEESNDAYSFWNFYFVIKMTKKNANLIVIFILCRNLDSFAHLDGQRNWIAGRQPQIGGTVNE